MTTIPPSKKRRIDLPIVSPEQDTSEKEVSETIDTPTSPTLLGAYGTIRAPTYA